MKIHSILLAIVAMALVPVAAETHHKSVQGTNVYLHDYQHLVSNGDWNLALETAILDVQNLTEQSGQDYTLKVDTSQTSTYNIDHLDMSGLRYVHIRGTGNPTFSAKTFKLNFEAGNSATRCNIYQMTFDGVRGLGTDGAYNNLVIRDLHQAQITGNTFINASQSGLVLWNLENAWANGNTFWNIGADHRTLAGNHIGSAIIFQNVHNGSASSNTITKVWQIGIFVSSQDGYSSYIDIQQNTLTDIADNGIRTQPHAPGSVSNIAIAYNHVSGVNIDCIRANGDAIQVRNNTLYGGGSSQGDGDGATTNGIKAATLTNSIIDGNTINGTSSGISLIAREGDITNTTVSNNTVHPGSPYQGAGIRIANSLSTNAVSNITVSGNTLRGYTYGGIVLEGEPGLRMVGIDLVNNGFWGSDPEALSIKCAYANGTDILNNQISSGNLAIYVAHSSFGNISNNRIGSTIPTSYAWPAGISMKSTTSGFSIANNDFCNLDQTWWVVDQGSMNMVGSAVEACHF